MAGSYSSLKSILREAIDNLDEPMVRALIDNIVPLANEEDQNYVRDVIAVEAYRSKTAWVKDIFVSAYPAQDQSATKHLLECLELPWMKRSMLQESVDALNKNYGNVLYSAFFKADFEIVNLLVNSGRPAPIITFDPENGRVQADNVEVKHQFEPRKNFANIEEFKAVVAHMVDAVKQGRVDLFKMIGRFAKNEFLEACEKTEPTPFGGAIPRIDAGVINNPELLIAFADQHKVSALPKIHGRVFAYVKPEEVRGIDEIKLYSAVKRIACSGVEVSFDDIARPEAMTDVVDLNNGREPCPLLDQLPCADLYVSFIRRDSSDAETTFKKEETCRLKMLSDTQYMGLEIPPGYCMASMDVKCLEFFELGAIDPHAMKAAVDYADDFFPAEILTAYCEAQHDKVERPRRTIKNEHPWELFDYAAKNKDADKIFAAFKDEFWINLYRRYAEHLSPESIMAGHSRFGLLHEPERGFLITAEELNVLYEGRYKFVNGSDGCVFELPKENNISILHDYYRKLISMNAWPSNIDRPKDCYEALKLATKANGSGLYKTLIEHYGPEASVKAAKTPKQYERIREIFSSEQLKPFVDLMPLNQVGKLFTLELNV
jgi:hypothetical protein